MRRSSLARALLYAAALPSAWFGLVYLSHSLGRDGWAAAYHAQIVQGLARAALPAPVAALYATLIGVIGSLFLATSVSQLVLASSLGTPRATSAGWWSLAAMNGIALVGLIVVNLRNNGLASSWWLNAIVLAIVLTGLALAGRPGRAV